MTRFFELIYPRFVWRMPPGDKCIYLTFDDGPIPEVTPGVLQVLKEFQAEATFFCVGDNIRKHPHIFQQVLEAGHSIGNHTFHHLNGWKTPLESYLQNVERSAKMYPTRLFRPPYGRITLQQARALQPQRQIVMWSVLTRDYSASLPPQKCLQNAIKNTRDGSIVLFHDSLKAQRTLEYVLPRYLAYFKSRGYQFRKLI